MRRFAVSSALLGIWVGFSSNSFAQVVPLDPGGDFDAMFQRVLADPSNVELTLRFAALAKERGDYESAIGAYERLLFYNPRLGQAKLELGVLYFQLTSYTAARSYLQAAIESPQTPPEVRAIVDEYLLEIDRRLSPNRITGVFYSGFRYQTNATAGPGGDLIRQSGQDVALDSIFARRPDWNWFGLSTIEYVHDFGNQRGDLFEATFGAYYSKQFEVQRLNLGALEAIAGPRLMLFPESFTGASIKIYGIANGIWLGDNPYYTTLGAGTSVRVPLGPFTIVEPIFEYRDRRFYDSLNYPTASQQTGHVFTYAASISGRFTTLIRWLVRGGYEQNFADSEFNSYRKLAIDFGIPISFTVGGSNLLWTLMPYAGMSRVSYNAANPAIDPIVVREDREWHAGVSLDAQLWKNAGIRVQVYYTKNDSNLVNFTNENLAVSFGPAVRF